MAWSERVLTGRSSRHPGEPWPGGPSGRGAAGARADLAGPADPLLDEAVQALLAEAQRKAEAQGFETGLARGEAELTATIVAAQAFAHKLETAVPRDVEMLARTVAELSVLIARRIVGAELRHDPSVLIAAIEGGLRQAAGASVITVELHPMVVDAVEAVWVTRHGSRHRGFTWSFNGDPTLPPDGCRLRTEHGLVEAGFEDQLAEVTAALDAAIPGYLGSALGPMADAAGPGVITSPAVHPVPAPMTPAADLDPDEQAGLGLGDLDLEALAGLGPDDTVEDVA